jgi:hypothetical protein
LTSNPWGHREHVDKKLECHGDRIQS